MFHGQLVGRKRSKAGKSLIEKSNVLRLNGSVRPQKVFTIDLARTCCKKYFRTIWANIGRLGLVSYGILKSNVALICVRSLSLVNQVPGFVSKPKINKHFTHEPYGFIA